MVCLCFPDELRLGRITLAGKLLMALIERLLFSPREPVSVTRQIVRARNAFSSFIRRQASLRYSFRNTSCTASSASCGLRSNEKAIRYKRRAWRFTSDEKAESRASLELQASSLLLQTSLSLSRHPFAEVSSENFLSMHHGSGRGRWRRPHLLIFTL